MRQRYLSRPEIDSTLVNRIRIREERNGKYRDYFFCLICS